MVRPIPQNPEPTGPHHKPPPLPAARRSMLSATALTPQQLNALANTLYVSTYDFFPTAPSSQPANPFTFAQAMTAISQFMAQYPKGGTPPTDPYLEGLWNDLIATNGSHTTCLADLASDFTTNGFKQGDLTAFNAFLSDNTLASTGGNLWDNFAGGIAELGDQRSSPGLGHYMPNPQTLDQGDFGVFCMRAKSIPNPPTLKSLQAFLLSVSALNGDLTVNSSSDGLTSILNNLFNTIPLDPTSTTPGNTTLAYLAAHDSTGASLQALLQGNPALLGDIQQAASKLTAHYGSVEWG